MAPLLAALPLAFLTEQAGAAPDPNMTIVKSPEQLTWVDMFNSGEGAKIYAAGGKIVSTANLYGETSKPGIYYVLIKWYPGFMSAPHWYETDRLCVVVSGTWWVTSGETFDPDSTVPAPAGTFVRRVAKTPHYDGVKSDGKEPATIAICGMGPITAHWLEVGQAGVAEGVSTLGGEPPQAGAMSAAKPSKAAPSGNSCSIVATWMLMSIRQPAEPTTRSVSPSMMRASPSRSVR